MEKEKPTILGRNLRLWIAIILGIMLIYLVVSISFYGTLFLKVPKFVDSNINLTKSQVYSNMHDFKQENNVIISTSTDPWIEVKLNEEISLSSTKIIIDSLSTEQTNAQIYYADDKEDFSGDKYVNFVLKKGENIVNFPKELTAQRLRIDLTDAQGISINVSSIEFKVNQNNIFLPWLIFIVISFLYSGIILYACCFNKDEDKRNIIKLSIIITIIFIVLYSKFIFKGYAYAFLDVGSDTIWGYAPSYQLLIQKILSGNFSAHTLSIELGTSIFSNVTIFEFPFIIFLFIFNGKNMYIGILIATYLKYILIAVFIFKYFKRLKYRSNTAMICAILWSYTGFNILWGQHYWFLTAIVYFSLFMFLIESALQGEKKYWIILVPIISVYSIISMYFLFSALVFGGLYSIIRLYYLNKNVKDVMNGVLKYICFNLLGIFIGLAVSCNWINVFLESARANIAPSASIFSLNLSSKYITTLLGRTFSTAIFGTVDYSGINNLYEAPMLSTSMLIFGAIVFSINQNKKNIILLLVILISLIWPFANYLFILTSTVERWYYILAFIQIVVIGNYINNLISGKFHFNKITNIATLVVPLFLLVVLYFEAQKQNMNVNLKIIICCIIFVILFWSIAKIRESGKVSITNIAILVTLAVCFEIIVINYPAVNTRNMLTTKQYIEFFENDTSEAIKYIKNNDNGLYRIKTYNHRGWLNDAEFYNYYGTDGYSSVSNKYYYEFIKNLGETDSAYSIANFPNYLDVAKENNVIQTLLGVKYVTAQEQPSIGYEKNYQFNDISVYRNTLYVPMGFAYYGLMDKQEYLGMTRQQKDLSLLNAFYSEDSGIGKFDKADLSKFDNKLIQIYPSDETSISTYGIDNISKKDGIDGTLTSKDANIDLTFNKIGEDSTKGFEIGIDMESPKTGLFSGILFKEENGDYTEQNQVNRYLLEGRKMYYLYVNAKTLSGIKIQPFIGDSGNAVRNIKIHKITVRPVNYEYDSLYSESARQLQKNAGENISYANDTYNATFNNLQNKPAMFCIPIAYSENWNAQINGSQTKIYRINDGMMGVLVEQGKSNIKLSWRAKGLSVAICISCLSLLIYMLIIIKFKRKSNDSGI